MKTVSTLEEINQLPCRSIIVGPSWDDELYQKTDSMYWLTPGSEHAWTPEDLENRGPFAVLRDGEIMDDECRPLVLQGDRPKETVRFPLRIASFPIGQVEIRPSGSIELHHAREDIIMAVRNAIHELE